MNTLKYFTKSILPIALLLCGVAFTACTDDITAGKPVNEGAYDGVGRVEGMLLDLNTNKQESVIELRSDNYKTSVYFTLTTTPGKGVDVKVQVDPAYLETYNQKHNTEFVLFPAAQVELEHGGALLLAPDEQRSTNMGITLSASADLKADVTYVIPLTATSTTAGITLSESASHAVYLVKVLRTENGSSEGANCDKGPDAMKTVLYFEVNDVNPLNALEFVLKDSGKLFFDEIVLFSANINYDAVKKRVYVLNNPNVQFLLDNSETFLQPLRKRGMKVILGILGNWDESGVAQLSPLGARQFAAELASYCYSYNLDGIGFDDEYSEDPDLGNPLFAKPSKEAAARLLFETKKAMPDKTVMVYYLGEIGSNLPSVDGILPSEFVDYAVDDYGAAAYPMQGMTLKDCSGMSIELQNGAGDSSEREARANKAAGYGYYMFFSLNPTNYFNDKDQVTRCQTVCKGLYEEELLTPTHYYKKNDATRYKF